MIVGADDGQGKGDVMAILIKGNPKEGEYKLIKTTDGWILEGKDIAYCGTELDDEPTILEAEE